MNRPAALALSALCVVKLGVAGSAHAPKADFRWKAEAYSDLCFEASEKVRFERSESGASAEVTRRYGNDVLGKIHLELVYTERDTATKFASPVAGTSTVFAKVRALF